MGFKITEAEARAKMAEKQSARDEHVSKLVEKYSKSKGLAFGNGKLEEMMEKDAKKTSNLLIMLENTEKKAYGNKQLLENMRNAELQNNVLSGEKLKESIQTGNASALLMPSDIVKISRIAYTNAIAEEVFDVWGMESMKDSIWKLETVYGDTERGATKDDPIIEKYNDGRYPTTVETGVLTDGVKFTAFGPLLKYRVAFFDANNNQIGNDDGQGNIYIDGTKQTGTIDYEKGEITLTFPVAHSAINVQYVADFEDKTYMDEHTGTTLLNLIEYPFQAVLKPMKLEWTRFAEDMLESKMGFSAKDTLIAGAGEEFKKAFDEQCITLGIRAAKSWTGGTSTFDCDWKTKGAVSAYDYAQNVNQGFTNSEMATYRELGRLSDKTNMIVDSKVYSYLTKNKRFTEVTPSSKVGIFKVGDFMGRGVYLAPDALFGSDVDTTNGVAYLFGKNTQGMNVDSPVSVGCFGTGLTTPTIEHPNFTSEMGLGCYKDSRILQPKMATVLKFTNMDKA